MKEVAQANVSTCTRLNTWSRRFVIITLTAIVCQVNKETGNTSSLELFDSRDNVPLEVEVCRNSRRERSHKHLECPAVSVNIDFGESFSDTYNAGGVVRQDIRLEDTGNAVDWGYPRVEWSGETDAVSDLVDDVSLGPLRRTFGFDSLLILSIGVLGSNTVSLPATPCPCSSQYGTWEAKKKTY